MFEFANDTIVITTGDTADNLEGVANDALQRISEVIHASERKNGSCRIYKQV